MIPSIDEAEQHLAVCEDLLENPGPETKDIVQILVDHYGGKPSENDEENIMFISGEIARVYGNPSHAVIVDPDVKKIELGFTPFRLEAAVDIPSEIAISAMIYFLKRFRDYLKKRKEYIRVSTPVREYLGKEYLTHCSYFLSQKIYKRICSHILKDAATETNVTANYGLMFGKYVKPKDQAKRRKIGVYGVIPLCYLAKLLGFNPMHSLSTIGKYRTKSIQDFCKILYMKLQPKKKLETETIVQMFEDLINIVLKWSDPGMVRQIIEFDKKNKLIDPDFKKTLQELSGRPKEEIREFFSETFRGLYFHDPRKIYKEEFGDSIREALQWQYLYSLQEGDMPKTTILKKPSTEYKSDVFIENNLWELFEELIPKLEENKKINKPCAILAISPVYKRTFKKIENGYQPVVVKIKHSTGRDSFTCLANFSSIPWARDRVNALAKNLRGKYKVLRDKFFGSYGSRSDIKIMRVLYYSSEGVPDWEWKLKPLPRKTATSSGRPTPAI